MIRWTLIGLGVLLLLVGAVWSLQGFGILPGSFMSGQSFWATIGLLALVSGLVLIFAGWRRGTAGSGS